jgi:hypothetical protein
MQQTIVLDESGANSDDVNLAHLFSSVNRKMMAPVDKKGNAQLFHVQVKTLCDHASNELRTTIKTANTGYVTKQAVKAWYRVWRQKLRDAGTSLKDLGPYGSVFKPRLQNTSYASGGDHWGGTAVRSGEWNYTDIIFDNPVNSGSASGLEASDMVSQAPLYLIGASSEVSGGDETEDFDGVGMISSWIASRSGSPGTKGGDASADAQFGADNPLIFARTDKMASDVMLDEIRDLQVDEAPYQDSDLDDLFIQAVLNHSAADSGMATVSAPCGWLRLETSEAATVEITLLGISDM